MTILYIWTVVAATQAANVYASPHTISAWRAEGEFRSAQRCADAAERLSLKPLEFRCISK